MAASPVASAELRDTPLFGKPSHSSNLHFRWPTQADLANLAALPKLSSIRTKGGPKPGLTAIHLVFENLGVSSRVMNAKNSAISGDYQTISIKSNIKPKF